MFPKGLIIAERPIIKTEHVSVDDTITTEPMAVLIIPEDKPDTIQIYLKENGLMVLEYGITELLLQLPPEELARIKVRLLQNAEEERRTKSQQKS